MAMELAKYHSRRGGGSTLPPVYHREYMVQSSTASSTMFRNLDKTPLADDYLGFGVRRLYRSSLIASATMESLVCSGMARRVRRWFPDSGRVARLDFWTPELPDMFEMFE